MSNLSTIEEQVMDRGEPITADQARELIALPHVELPTLIELAHRVRLRYCGEAVEVESLISAKTGGCPEDCAFCSQSARFDTQIATHPFLSTKLVLASAKSSEELGATQFCIVVAVRGPDRRLMDQVLEATAAIRRETTLDVHCSLGILTREQARELAQAGVERYNHNLETARSFFPTIVSTHTWEEREETCRLVKDEGMELCSGGIFGMGESWEQRVEFACELRALGPAEIPLNFLNPRPGTPLGDQELLPPLDAIRICALWRLFFPRETIRYAGGREVVLRDLQSLGLLSGVNGLIMGNYLTTTGRSPEQDLRMLDDLGMPRAQTHEPPAAVLP
ncbi:MAG: biotin synthase BioB [Dehalococcoidia bacterium]